MCVPPDLVESILLSCHEDITAGHLGTTRTLEKVCKRFFWPKMIHHIAHVRSCVDCQTKKKVPSRPSGFLTSIKTDRPFQKVGIDLLGPFPKSTMGNKHIIVAIDYFSNWVVAQAVPSADSNHVVDFFVRRIVLQHGAPLAIISDRGKCLTSGFTENFFRALQTNHLVTTAYHPQCNGLVDRFNHTFSDTLSMYVSS